ncbi:MAG: hypothetical protein KDK36_19585 [Leptospiraceae bacterium]|nr:hypothetical protein [Leptospiraceae bacterium]
MKYFKWLFILIVFTLNGCFFQYLKNNESYIVLEKEYRLKNKIGIIWNHTGYSGKDNYSTLDDGLKNCVKELKTNQKFNTKFIPWNFYDIKEKKKNILELNIDHNDYYEFLGLFGTFLNLISLGVFPTYKEVSYKLKAVFWDSNGKKNELELPMNDPLIHKTLMGYLFLPMLFVEKESLDYKLYFQRLYCSVVTNSIKRIEESNLNTNGYFSIGEEDYYKSKSNLRLKASAEITDKYVSLSNQKGYFYVNTLKDKENFEILAVTIFYENNSNEKIDYYGDVYLKDTKGNKIIPNHSIRSPYLEPDEFDISYLNTFVVPKREKFDKIFFEVKKDGKVFSGPLKIKR